MRFSSILTMQKVKMCCSFGLFSVADFSSACRLCELTGELETIC